MGILVFDGATGSNLQNADIPASVWQGREGCNEWLNLAFPQAIIDLHASFIDAGSQALETNTFGANRITLAEYGLEDRMEEINAAAVANARKAAASRGRSVAVVGSMGPGTKLPSLGHIDPDVLAEAVSRQALALIGAGVDMLILETCQDMLQVKRGVVAVLQAMGRGRKVPLMVSLTLESSGVMLVGSDISAAAAILDPFPIASLGLNCATGPAEMESHLRYLHENWDRPISCMPNQGLPEIADGKTVYPLSPEEFAEKMLRFTETYRLGYVGGCCGTSPAHIKAMTDALRAGGLL
ncbi:MAG: homocysteine S-methyltransferase family protein [Spirochaetia bacterium]|jgi:5-methyltetrahydrofolate--homocysteine methyltransferase|nr:homocysteine S-methyltransferase family protein [Spirochaetia bacterium]